MRLIAECPDKLGVRIAAMLARIDRTVAMVDSLLASALRDRSDKLNAVVLAEIRRDVPAFARPAEGGFGRSIRSDVAAVLEQLVAVLESGTGHRGQRVALSRRIGAREARLQRGLESILSAYRVAARMVWREVAAEVLREDGTGAALADLGETIFGFFDEISTAAAEGYAEEHALREGLEAHHRRLLTDLLLRDPPVDAAVLLAQAETAGWVPPAEVRALVTAADASRTMSQRLGAQALVLTRGDVTVAIMAAGDPRLWRRGAAALDGAAAVLGPAVAWRRAARSFARAVRVLGLVEDGVIAAHGLVDTDEHLGTLWLHADPQLAADLAERRLRPLEGLRAPTRARLAATLLSWLEHQGHQQAVAQELGVHHQTVRYRLAQLRDLLGPELDDPVAQLEIRLALTAAPAAVGRTGAG